MIKANFNTYASYVTDSLYQWDLNQKLSVSGLNLTVAPEVHFSNSNMDRAIVRQATLDNYIVSVDIPNSLLQEALTIKAHICIYDNDTLKVIELIEIPVNPRVRPLDYKIENTDGEIYSFNALENLINNKYDAIVLNNEEILAEVEAITTDVQNSLNDITSTSILIKGIESIVESKSITSSTEKATYYTYTATKKCIINITYNAIFNNSPVKASWIYKGNVEIASVNTTNASSSASLSVCQILNVGDVITCASQYTASSSNNIKVYGCILYLE